MDCLNVLLTVITTAGIHAQDQTRTPQIKSTDELMTQPMNGFRQFPGGATPIYDFYEKVLGLKQLTTCDLSGNPNVARFGIETSRLTFTEVVPR